MSGTLLGYVDLAVSKTKPPVSSFRAATKPKCIVCQVVLRVRKKSNRIGGPREDPRGIGLDLY